MARPAKKEMCLLADPLQSRTVASANTNKAHHFQITIPSIKEVDRIDCILFLLMRNCKHILFVDCHVGGILVKKRGLDIFVRDCRGKLWVLKVQPARNSSRKRHWPLVEVPVDVSVSM